MVRRVSKGWLTILIPHKLIIEAKEFAKKKRVNTNLRYGFIVKGDWTEKFILKVFYLKEICLKPMMGIIINCSTTFNITNTKKGFFREKSIDCWGEKIRVVLVIVVVCEICEKLSENFINWNENIFGVYDFSVVVINIGVTCVKKNCEWRIVLIWGINLVSFEIV